MSSSQLSPAYTALAMLLVANGAPIIAHRLFGSRWAWPVDLGRLWNDGRAILGPTKTWRGIVSAVGATACVASLLGLAATLGALFGALSMSGDLISSFVKRRFGVKSSDRILGLDQIPEAFLPTACLAGALDLDLWDVAVVTLGFLVFEIGLSRILYWLNLRK